MAYDPEAIRQALDRVRERSLGPTAVQDVASLLEEAQRHVRQVEGELTALRSTLETERVQRQNSVMEAERGLAAAQSGCAAAQAHAESVAALYDLADRLRVVTIRALQLEADLADLRQELAEERAEAQAAYEALAAQLQTATAETQTARAVAARHEQALQQIAQAPWWEQSGRDVARETLS